MTATTNDGGPELGKSRRLTVWAGVAALMLLPLMAREGPELTTWVGREELLFLSILFAGVVLAYELSLRVTDRAAYRTAFAMALFAALFQVWINGAVGIIGSEDNPVNLAFFAVAGFPVIASVLALFRPRPMARAMVATAVVQLLAFGYLAATGLGFPGPITIFFASLWLVSASLFRKAAG